MNKLTAEKCKTLIERLGEDKRSSRISIFGELYLQSLEIALPVLEQQEMITDSAPLITDKPDLITDKPDLITDTYRQIENDGWIEWKGGECPVADSFKVEVKYRSVYDDYEDYADRFAWNHDGAYDDIIAYRVIENDGREG